jgi:hypothetical protein
VFADVEHSVGMWHNAKPYFLFNDSVDKIRPT